MTARWEPTQDEGFGWSDLTALGKAVAVLAVLLLLLAVLLVPWERAPWNAQCPDGQVHVQDGSISGCFTPADVQRLDRSGQ